VTTRTNDRRAPYSLQSDKGGARSLADEVFEWLVDELVSGRLRPGQFLSENDLATLLEVSRSPVREALRRLANDRLVRVFPRRGTMVAELDAQDCEDLYVTRALIEGEVTYMAARYCPLEEFKAFRSDLAGMREAFPDPREFFEQLRRFRMRLFHACPNQTLTDIASSLWRRSLPIQGLLMQLPEQLWETIRFHDDLLSALERRDSDAARAIMVGAADRAREVFLGTFFLQLRDGHRHVLRRSGVRDEDTPSDGVSRPSEESRKPNYRRG
jgi:DNA-binding GntR family transcriptional regulator